MVNKPDFSDPMQVPGLNPLVQQLLSKATVQAFTALANMSAADFSLLSKMVSGLLSKKNFEGISKFNHLVTFLPSLQRLYPEAVKRLKAEPFAHSSKNHFADASKVLSSEGRSPKQPILSESFKDRLPQPFQGFPQERFSESASFKEFFKEPSLSKEFAREQRLFELSKERSERGERVDQPDSGTPDLDKQAPLQKEKGAPSKSIPQELRLSENPITERGLPAMLATMKEVLSILAYFTNHIPALKLENPRVFQNVMESAMAQLVQPVATFSEGEFTSQNREVPGQQSPEKTFLKEKSLPLPSAVRQKSEKSLREHRIEKAPNSLDRLDREYRSSSTAPSRPTESQELGSLKSSSFMGNPKIVESEAKLASVSIPAERIAISAAPFSFQHPISTAPRKPKKKSQDPWEEEEEHHKDEEDPFSPNS